MPPYGDDGEQEASTASVLHPEFKADIVERCVHGDRSVTQVTRAFDLTVSAVRGWVRQAEMDAGTRDGLTTEEEEELSRVRRRLAGSDSRECDLR
jgi:transposase